jgi:hypothetical protein
MSEIMSAAKWLQLSSTQRAIGVNRVAVGPNTPSGKAHPISEGEVH